MTEQNETNEPRYEGQVVNGYMLGADNQWHQMASSPPPQKSSSAVKIALIIGGVVVVMFLGLVVLGGVIAATGDDSAAPTASTPTSPAEETEEPQSYHRDWYWYQENRKIEYAGGEIAWDSLSASDKNNICTVWDVSGGYDEFIEMARDISVSTDVDPEAFAALIENKCG